ncbi:MAG: ZIP family metal transporter [Pseudonocardiaceae bacterium]
MTTALGFAAGASLPLLAGAIVGVFWCPPRRLIAVALAFAAGALISAVSFELFQESYNAGGALRAGLGFAAGATVFVVTDALLDRVTAANPTGFALLAGVTLDGVPENVALGVSLNAAGSLALLVAVFASNFPEALAGAVSMQEQGRSRGAVVALWGGATLLLGVAVVVGRFAFAGASPEQLALPLAFAGGAVLASVIDTLAPEAFGEGGPLVALASAAGFFTAFVLSA